MHGGDQRWLPCCPQMCCQVRWLLHIWINPFLFCLPYQDRQVKAQTVQKTMSRNALSTALPWTKPWISLSFSLPRSCPHTPSTAIPTPTHPCSPVPGICICADSPGNCHSKCAFTLTWVILLFFVRKTTPCFLPAPTCHFAARLGLMTSSFVHPFPLGISPAPRGAHKLPGKVAQVLPQPSW